MRFASITYDEYIYIYIYNSSDSKSKSVCVHSAELSPQTSNCDDDISLGADGKCEQTCTHTYTHFSFGFVSTSRRQSVTHLQINA